MARAKKNREPDEAQEPTLAPKMYERYFNWVREAEKPNLIKNWALIVVGSIIAIVVATLLPWGGNWAKAIIAFPAAMGVYAIAYGVLERRAALGDKPHPKDVYSPRRRRTIALFAIAIILVASFTLSNYLPYALGGALIAGASLFFYDFIRLTPGELEVQKAGLVDVRELAEAGLIPDDEELEDIDWTWEDEPAPDWDDIEGKEEDEIGLPSRRSNDEGVTP